MGKVLFSLLLSSLLYFKIQTHEEHSLFCLCLTSNTLTDATLEHFFFQTIKETRRGWLDNICGLAWPHNCKSPRAGCEVLAGVEAGEVQVISMQIA